VYFMAMLFTEMSFLVFRNLKKPNQEKTMKKTVRQGFLWHFIAFTATTLSSQKSNCQTDSSLNDVGDIAFLAWSTSSQDGYAFVLMDYCLPGDSVVFTDEEWTGSGFYSTNGEGDNTWFNSTSNTLNPGTVIVIENADNNPSANIGSVTETDAGFSIAATDQIFAFTGTRSNPHLLSMIGDTTSPGNQTLSGTGLVPNETALHMSSERIYTGQTACSNGLGNCLSMIYNPNSWKQIDSTLVFPRDVISGMNGSSLPVELLYLELNADGSLTWATASEVNNAGFDIEVSVDGLNWIHHGHVSGAGNSVEIQKYFYPISPNVGFNYVRLIQIDFDGEKTESDILRIPHTDEDETTYRLFNFYGELITECIRPEDVQLLPEGLFYLVPEQHRKCNRDGVRKIYKYD